MYKITNKARNSILWDAKTGKPLAEFKDGVFETAEKKVADALKAVKGCTVKEIKEEPGTET